MNDDILKGKWAQLKGRVKEQWGKLTDDEIDELDGRRDQLVGKVQERYGIAAIKRRVMSRTGSTTPPQRTKRSDDLGFGISDSRISGGRPKVGARALPSVLFLQARPAGMAHSDNVSSLRMAFLIAFLL
jgi:uncharacterized protein YjbJ (UPF0337 family)